MSSQKKPTRPTLNELICGENGLGYCCEWLFFTQFRKTGVIAERLGVTTRAVRYHRKPFREGELDCEQRANCMKYKVRYTVKPPKPV